MKRSSLATLVGLAAVSVLDFLPTAAAFEAAITLLETAGVERKGEPVSVGVPLPRGLLKETSSLCVTDSKGQKIPAQFEPLAWWWPTEKHPDTDKTIRWVLVDFQADVPAGGAVRYTLSNSGGNPQPLYPVRIEKMTDEKVIVQTGPLSFTVNGREFRLFDNVDLAGRRIVSASAEDGLRIEGVDGKRYLSSKDLVPPPTLTNEDYRPPFDDYLKTYQHNPPEKIRVVVEKRGPLHAVVMIDGVMQAMSPGGEHQFVLYNAAGDRVGPVTITNRDEKLGFRFRIHAYAGKPYVRVYHTLINLRGKSHTDTDQNRYRSAAYIADAIKQPGRFLIESLELATTLSAKGSLKYRLGGDVVHAGDLAAGGRVILYQDSSAGWIWQTAENKIYDPVLKANIDFLKVKVGLEKPYYEYSDIHYKILTGQDGCTFMGYKVWDAAGSDLAAGNRAVGWADVSDGEIGLTTAVRWFWEMYPKAIELDTSGKVIIGILPRQWSRGHFLDGKIHRTHEIFYRFHGAEDAAAAETSVKAFQKPLVAHCGVDWYLRSGACHLFARPDPANWPNYEAQITTAVHLGVNPKVNPSFDSSYEVEREKEDAFGWQHFGDTAKRGFRGFSQFEEFDSSRCLIMHFWRTGDPAFFQRAEELVRFLMGIPCFGGGYGHQHPESSHNWIQGLIDYYSMTGLAEAREAIEAMEGYYRREWDPKAFSWHYNGRNAAYALDGLRQFFEWTGDPAWLKAANICIRSVKQRTRPVSGFYGGNPAEFMSHVLCHASGRYAMLTGDEDAVDLLLGLAGHFKPFSGRCDGGAGTADVYAHATMLTGDRRYLDAAIKNIKDEMAVDSQGPHYRTGECSSKTWSGSVGGYWQIFFYALKEWKPADTIPPAPIKDLVVTPGPQPGSVTLSWTNTGDDGVQGRSHKIQIKYASGEIVEFVPWAKTGGVEATVAPEWKDKVNFWYAENAVGEPKPGESGTQQTWTLSGLPSGRELYFAMKVHDEEGNRSEMSNCVKIKVP